MKRVLFYLLCIIVMLMVFTGIFEGISGEKPMLSHIVMTSIFVILCVVHLIFNRRAIVKYIRGK
jgi:hypothetical protein